MLKILNKQEKQYVAVPYGSRVYGTFRPDSDYDYIIIVPTDDFPFSGQEYSEGNINAHVYNLSHFQYELVLHKIYAIEAYSWLRQSSHSLVGRLKFSVVEWLLRSEISAKASNSWVKAKKKLLVENEVLLGLKSLWHSLRILLFGCQIAHVGMVADFGEANSWWEKIQTIGNNWDELQKQFKPVYNDIASEFRKVCPK